MSTPPKNPPSGDHRDQAERNNSSISAGSGIEQFSTSETAVYLREISGGVTPFRCRYIHIPTVVVADSGIAALLTVREADDDEMRLLRSERERGLVAKVKSGWVPSKMPEWVRVKAVASLFENPPSFYDKDAGEWVEPEGHASHLNITVILLRSTYGRLPRLRAPLQQAQAPRPAPIDWSAYDDEYLHLPETVERPLDRFYPGGRRSASAPSPEWTTTESPETIARLQADLQRAEQQFSATVAEHPWVAYHLGLGPDPTSVSLRTENWAPAAPRFPHYVNGKRTPTYESCAEAKRRVRDGKTTMDPRWYADLDVMLTEVILEIGERPTVRTLSGRRWKHTLNRTDNARGYEPGNVDWGTWGQQARNRGPRKKRT
jgi:hypothetical protein